MSDCGFCGASVPSIYRKAHHRICLRKRLLNGEITKEEYLKRKHLTIEVTPDPERAVKDKNQRTLWAWQ